MMKYMMAVQDNKQKSSSLPELVMFMFVFVFMFMYLMFMMMVMKCFWYDLQQASEDKQLPARVTWRLPSWLSKLPAGEYLSLCLSIRFQFCLLIMWGVHFGKLLVIEYLRLSISTLQPESKSANTWLEKLPSTLWQNDNTCSVKLAFILRYTQLFDKPESSPE